MSANASGPSVAYRISPACEQLTRAVLAAAHAPSILNTQPWRWRITHDSALLFADRRRQLSHLDPSGRLLTLSCGAALHHACIALAATGIDIGVDIFPDGGDTDLLAVLHCQGPAAPSARAQRLRRAIVARRSDRRPFSARPVPQERIDRLVRAAHHAGACLHMARSQDLGNLALAAGQAADAVLTDPACRAELSAWMREPGMGNDGVPVDTLAPLGGRRVPARDFTALGFGARVDTGDREARYGIVVTNGDGPHDWLVAGNALSAVLLTATTEHLATSPMSDLVEQEVARHTLRRTIGGVGYPAIGVRIGLPSAGPPPPRVPRRPGTEFIEVVADEVATGGDELVPPSARAG
ncbi:Acg family FMN-binding oxidoreductase [Dactylosporangium sp. CS-047395]|uniref:Acg family FMN-binding oxidoreductase n=1 Tax=Dactylosporangium sp. CS-047395 TaxID=3239936 RepID=UPI003D8F4A06